MFLEILSVYGVLLLGGLAGTAVADSVKKASPAVVSPECDVERYTENNRIVSYMHEPHGYTEAELRNDRLGETAKITSLTRWEAHDKIEHQFDIWADKEYWMDKQRV